MSEHTPGPWECSYHSQGSFFTDKGVIEGTWMIHRSLHKGPQKSIQAVAIVPGVDHGQYRANARLIAAAPDLLAACKLLVRVAGLVPIFQIGDGAEALEHGVAAITKAEPKP